VGVKVQSKENRNGNVSRWDLKRWSESLSEEGRGEQKTPEYESYATKKKKKLAGRKVKGNKTSPQ
jgi:hypothetical protein